MGFLLVIPAVLTVLTCLSAPSTAEVFRFCLYLKNIPTNSNNKAEVYLEVVNFGDTVLSKTCQVPTSLVNADIGDIYEYHEKGGGWDELLGGRLYFAGSNEFIGKTAKFGPASEWSDKYRTSIEYKIYNSDKGKWNEWDIKRDGKQSYLGIHYMIGNRVKNTTHARLKEKNV
ncbi:uncharacterized protein LOC110862222 isoform X2 [Folsomia candida]|uniref:Uncharacterized protein n=2 Tax=Folsomia candida TaxID=158441 RepID=A0A226D0T0_FOLCA|nr:uncharacterized protein LOC110862222 isoform X2 [Folsomia candida]OXA37896.1 hypothetical protein Fcan01_27345 [Folsomia candida]